MSGFLILLLGCLLTASLCGCNIQSNATNLAQSPAKSQNTLPSDCDSYLPDSFGDLIGDENIKYTNASTLSYLDYKVAKRIKKERLDSSGYYEDIQYAVLKKDNKVVASFDGHPGRLSEVRFALFPLFASDVKQLIVEQTSHRFWRYWVVNLAPEFEVIYDSGDYDTIYGLKTIDADGDGKYELIQSLGTFWFFRVPGRLVGLSNINSPRPEIVFNYNADRRKYIPANHRFQSEVLRNIEERIIRTHELNQTGPSCLSAVLDVVLRYVYAGKEEEAWAFFEREYEAPDKEVVRAEVVKTLRHDSVYKAVYKHDAT